MVTFNEILESSNGKAESFANDLYYNIGKMGIDERTKSFKYLCKPDQAQTLDHFMHHLRMKHITIPQAIDQLTNLMVGSAIGADEVAIFTKALGREYYKQNTTSRAQTKIGEDAYATLISMTYNYRNWLAVSGPDQIAKHYNQKHFKQDIAEALSVDQVKHSFNDEKLNEIYNKVATKVVAQKSMQIKHTKPTTQKPLRKLLDTLKNKLSFRKKGYELF